MIPGSPLIKYFPNHQNRLLKRTEFLFSYERYPLVYYLRFHANKSGKSISSILVPDYMCHEVNKTYRDFGYKVSFYPVSLDFSIDLDTLDNAVNSMNEKPQVILIFHAYGKIVKNLQEILNYCQMKGIIPLEDCAHLPYPYFAHHSENSSNAKFYTLRKVYPVPYGAIAVIKDNQTEFDQFIQNNVKIIHDLNSYKMIKWILREYLKRSIVFLGISVKRSYRDLSQDPLKKNNFAHKWVKLLIEEDEWEIQIIKRRLNYIYFLKNIERFTNWITPIEYDVQTDVPYKFIFYLREDIDKFKFINYFLSHGISTELGLALEDQFSKNDKNPFNRHVSFPLHQSIEFKHIEYICNQLEQFQKLENLNNKVNF